MQALCLEERDLFLHEMVKLVCQQAKIRLISIFNTKHIFEKFLAHKPSFLLRKQDIWLDKDDSENMVFEVSFSNTKILLTFKRRQDF